jgi:hypothetical protein
MRLLGWVSVLGIAAVAAAPVHALERLTFINGQTQDCERHEVVGDTVRIYTSDENYYEIKANEVVSVDALPDPVPAVTPTPASVPRLTKVDLGEMLASAGQQHNIDADLLASIVKAESNGQARAVSRAGAQGLMQLMPGTARAMGVSDSFEPQQNINGGTQYHDNIALAVAAYNAGPAAVDRYHGIPPYRETRAYVARVIREFNRRKALEIASK